MSTFEDDFAAAGWPSLVDQFGESWRYRSLTGVHTPLTAIPLPERADDSQDPEGRRLTQVKRLKVPLTDDAIWKLTQSPKPSGTMVEGTGTSEVEWAIQAVEEKHAAYAVLRLVRQNRAEASRPNYRR